MKTITIKLPEDEARDLDDYIKKRNYPSKSEFIRNLIIDRLDRNRKEKIGWMILAEKSMQKIWSSSEDQIWEKYL